MTKVATKEIKIRLKQDKQHKKRKKQMDAENSINQKMYFDRLDKSIKKKKKRKQVRLVCGMIRK